MVRTPASNYAQLLLYVSSIYPTESSGIVPWTAHDSPATPPRLAVLLSDFDVLKLRGDSVLGGHFDDERYKRYLLLESIAYAIVSPPA